MLAATASEQPQVLVIAGATASGKSDLALALAKKIGAEIISADSRQIYHELTIGAAKPSREVLREVTHHFINEKHIGESFTAGDFAAEATRRIHNIHQQGKRVIVAGGSTLYLEGLLQGFADLPPANPDIRARLQLELEADGCEKLFERLRQRDPVQAATLDATKTQRLIRSLEIIELTGMSVTELLAGGRQQGDLSFLSFGLSMPREQLYQRINQRTERMLEHGLCQEAEMLYHQYRELPAFGRCSPLQSVGYSELFDCFEGKTSLSEAVSLIKQHTRNYAKRQLTFFRNRLTINWIDAPENNSELGKCVETCLNAMRKTDLNSLATKSNQTFSIKT